MKQRHVIFAPEALEDLLAIYDWIADAAGGNIAIDYMGRLESYCMGFSHASERGHLREDIRSDLRIVGFERRVTIAFSVSDERVTILRLFYGGRDWESQLV